MVYWHTGPGAQTNDQASDPPPGSVASGLPELHSYAYCTTSEYLGICGHPWAHIHVHVWDHPPGSLSLCFSLVLYGYFSAGSADRTGLGALCASSPRRFV